MKARLAFALVALSLALATAGCGDNKPSGSGGNGTSCSPACPPGQECVGGACVCDAKSCPTGCCNDGNCVIPDDQSNKACGVGGVACGACSGLTPTCAAGACTSACGQQGNGTCGAGCCSNGTCVAGADNASCGGGAGSCVDCTGSAIGHVCMAGTCGCNGDKDCPAGIACDLKTHSCSCGPANCQGCCDPTSGNCVTPSPSACGSAGSMCMACPSGEACVGGKCACDPSTCDGCCTADGCIPTSSETATACGTKGAACMACPSGQSCQGGACVCDAKSCPNGCCNNGICVPSTSQTAASCGKGGAACASCAAGLDCVAGSCKCDATTCANGCCDANGVCQPGNKGDACGTAGASCASCGAGQDCTGGSCACNATTCPDGCCDASGVCQKHSASACGNAGGACSTCATGQECSAAGSCTCDATSCPNGCCNGNSCVPYASETNSSCGTAGAACGVCSGLTPTCAAGACTATCGAAGNGSCSGGCCASNGSCAGGTDNKACGNGSSCVDCTTSGIGHVCRSGTCGCNIDGDCPGGQLCNTTTHTCGSCNASTCKNGCCGTDGLCKTPSTGTCGSNGAVCVGCASGQECNAAGSCVCDAASCPNGCCNGNTCVPYASQGNLSCGTAGASCGSCAGASGGGACVNGVCGCSGPGDCAAGSICNTATKQCVPGGSCTAGSCNGCCAGGVCTDGNGTGACGTGGGSCSDCNAGAPMCQGSAACTNHACAYSPSAPGTSCTPLYCTVGETCDGAGNCTGGTPRDCSGGQACMVCSCSNTSASCNCNPKTASAASGLTVTSSCLTAGTAAKLAVVLKLVDSTGAPATGATVTFATTGPTVTWVEPAPIEVAGTPGTYYRTMLAPTGTGSVTVSASASYCSTSTPITAKPVVNVAAAAPALGFNNGKFQGVAGCSPVGGHVRVKVIEAETGNPIKNASVLIGTAAGTPFVTSAAALFPTASPSGSNTAQTDANGFAEFVDFGSALKGAPIVTAGAPDRAYQTLYHFTGADQVLALPLRRPTAPIYHYTNATATVTVPLCISGNVYAGFMLEDTTLDQLGVFNVSSLVGPNKCIKTTGMDATSAFPENVYLPSQSALCLVALNSAGSLSVDGGKRILNMPFVGIPVGTATGGGPITDLIKAATFTSIGFLSVADAASGPINNAVFNLNNDTYAHKITMKFAGAPANTDVAGVTLLDYSPTAGLGTGALGIDGINFHTYTDTGTQVLVAASSIKGAPAGTKFFGAAVASFLPTNNDPRNEPVELAKAITESVLRGATPPFDGTADVGVNMPAFLGLAPAAVTQNGQLFTFGDATQNGTSPLYSVSTLSVSHTTWQPLQSPCETATGPSKSSHNYPQWIVVRPHANDAASCAGLTSVSSNCEAFTLPTLPATFPNATVSPQQQSGFEPYIGSGKTCTTDGNCVAGESCVEPYTGAGKLCMYNNGEKATEQYLWTLEDRAYNGTVIDAGNFDLTQYKVKLTQQAANKINW